MSHAMWDWISKPDINRNMVSRQEYLINNSIVLLAENKVLWTIIIPAI
jgi:hypothetical protein